MGAIPAGIFYKSRNVGTLWELFNIKNAPHGRERHCLWCWELSSSVYWGMLQYPLIGVNELIFNSLGRLMYI